MAHLKTVLVLCMGNACRSQMAEAILNHDLVGRVRALSAGARPELNVSDGAILALKDAGISTETLHTKSTDAVMGEPIDLVVTLCDNAREGYPVFPRPIPRMHVPFDDPCGASLEGLIRLREEIRERLIPVVCIALGGVSYTPSRMRTERSL